MAELAYAQHLKCCESNLVWVQVPLQAPFNLPASAKIMSIKTFIKKRPYLLWYVKNPENLSEAAIVESVLNYGSFKDVKLLISILGIKKTARIFGSQIKKERNNYRLEIKNYFEHYFNKYA